MGADHLPCNKLTFAEATVPAGRMPSSGNVIENRRGSAKIYLLVLAVASILITAAIWHFHGNTQLLVNEKDAQWIRFPEPFQLRIHHARKIKTSFRTIVKAPVIRRTTVLTFRSVGEATVFLDQKELVATPSSLTKAIGERQRVDLTPFLTPGSHVLRIDVSNTTGHPLLIAWSESPGLFAGESWEVSKDGYHWLFAVAAEKNRRLNISQTFPRLGPSIRSLAPFYISVFFLFFFWSLRKDKNAEGTSLIKPVNARSVRWFVMLAWLFMAINNFWKLPVDMGMDFKGHMQYISYVAQYGRIPLATDGWQMFQQPLYYLLAAGLYNLSHIFFNDDVSIRVIKLISVLCGMLQVEIAYRAVKLLYPRRESIQIFGVVLAGFMPMNLYMSQSIGNEPLAALLTSLAILAAIRMALTDNAATRERLLLLGFLLGLALLAKVSAILIFPPLLLFISFEVLASSGTIRVRAKLAASSVTVALLTAFLASGWYYIHNYMEMGHFFIGGWDIARKIVWWQDPGYRTLRQLYFFGESLFYPVFSSLYGFWDSIYSSLWADGYLSAYNRPPWNYPLMITGMWLALFPSAGILVGIGAALRMAAGKLRRILLMSAGSVLLYLSAILYIFITVPFLSSAKASYALGLLPCFALLAAAGFDVLTKNRYLEAASQALFACWAIGSYLCCFAL